MPTFKSIKELQKYLNTTVKNAAEDSLKQDVADAIIKELVSEYEDQVYSYEASFDGGPYDRRYDLIEEGSYFESYRNGTITIENTVKPLESLKGTPLNNPDVTLAEWIEHGNIPNIFNDKEYPWMKPRPVVKTVKERITKDGLASDAMKKGLEKRGIKCK